LDKNYGFALSGRIAKELKQIYWIGDVTAVLGEGGVGERRGVFVGHVERDREGECEKG